MLLIPSINCEVSLILTWSVNYVLTNKACREAVADHNPVLGFNIPINAAFKVKDTKLYVPAVTLSTQDDNKLLEQLIKRILKKN